MVKYETPTGKTMTGTEMRNEVWHWYRYIKKHNRPWLYEVLKAHYLKDFHYKKKED